MGNYLGTSLYGYGDGTTTGSSSTNQASSTTYPDKIINEEKQNQIYLIVYNNSNQESTNKYKHHELVVDIYGETIDEMEPIGLKASTKISFSDKESNVNLFSERFNGDLHLYDSSSYSVLNLGTVPEGKQLPNHIKWKYFIYTEFQKFTKEQLNNDMKWTNGTNQQFINFILHKLNLSIPDNISQ